MRDLIRVAIDIGKYLSFSRWLSCIISIVHDLPHNVKLIVSFNLSSSMFHREQFQNSVEFSSGLTAMTF